MQKGVCNKNGAEDTVTVFIYEFALHTFFWEKRMKKSILSGIVAAVVAAGLFCGCSSFPEPSEKTRTMLYASVEYYGSYTFGGTSDAEVKKQVSGITVKIKNIETRREYTLLSNAKGEIIKTNLPEGTYIISEISSDFEYDGREWWTTCVPRTNDTSAYFKIREGVVNLGIIRINMNFDTGSGRISWGYSPDTARERFEYNHPDSWWSLEDWFDMIGSRRKL